MESVENCPFFIGSTLKIVENSVENVEKGFVMGWILDDGSGKNYKFIIENYDVFGCMFWAFMNRFRDFIVYIRYIFNFKNMLCIYT